MMKAIHILKDGTIIDDITGKIVLMQGHENLYLLVRRYSNGSSSKKRTIKEE